jgi:uncharacterized protein (DUF1501 family)
VKTLTKPTNLSRRHLLRNVGAIGAGTAAAPWLMNLAAMAPAHAAGTGGYKALVCVFMYGGNDSYNTVLATDGDSWSNYLAARNSGDDPIALAPVGSQAQKGGAFNASLGGVLPIAPRTAQQGRAFALNPLLAPVRDMFNAGRLGIVANVGPLVQPTSKDQYLANSVPLPPKLFSHNDQQSVWQSGSSEGASMGWGGLMADRMMSGNSNAIFTSVTTGSAAVWLVGNTARRYSLGLNGAIHIGASDNALFTSPVAQQQLVKIMRNTREAQYFEQDHAAIVGRSIDAEAILTPALPAAGAGPWGTAGLGANQLDPLLCYKAPSTGLVGLNPITQQMQPILRMISAHSTLGMGRQIFFIGVPGCDTHDTQNTRHADIMAQLAQALGYWDTATRAMGADQNVTLFTASDFGRAFASNGTGSDHGWGGHHFVLGGGVVGGDIYGRFPTYGVTDGSGGFTSPDQLTDGQLLPSIGVDQYAATLGSWMGLSASDLASVLPNLSHFDVASRNLGFMKNA